MKGGKEPADTAANVPTVCGQFVILPFGSKRRAPTCKECRAKLLGKAKK